MPVSRITAYLVKLMANMGGLMSVLIREITPQDAEGYNAYRRQIADEPHNTIGLSAGEYTRTIGQERQRILSVVDDPNQQILVAVMDGVICGQCMCRGESKSVLRHAVTLGIDIAQAHRGQGIGHLLMSAMIEWAQSNPIITRVELDVLATNRRAISLYLKHGFVVEGCRRQAYFKDGVFVDGYVMGLLLNKKADA